MTYKKTNEALRDEHATIGGIDGKKTFIFDNAGNQITNFGGSASATVAIGSSATIYAVVNTAASGQASVVLDTGSRFIGLATVNIGSSNATLFAVVNTSAAGQSSVVLDTGVNYIGLATIDIGTSNGVAVKGNVTLSDSKGYIGLVTVTQASAARTITGNVTIQDGGGSITIDGNVGILGNVTLSDAKTFIGLVTAVTQLPAAAALGDTDANPTAPAVGAFNMGWSGGSWNRMFNYAPGDGASNDRGLLVNSRSMGWNGASWDRLKSDTTNGLDVDVTRLPSGATVTALTKNAGTLKTLIPLPVGLGNNSLATVAIPTNSNKVNITNLVLNSNITTEIALKSGVTYLTGNASIGVTIFPGGGFVMSGAPDSPSWIGLPSGAFVVEKRDPGGTVSKIGGGVIYFDE